MTDRMHLPRALCSLVLPLFFLGACGPPPESRPTTNPPAQPPPAEPPPATQGNAPGTPVVIGSGTALLRGLLQREETSTTANEPFVAGPGASLHMEIRVHPAADAPAPLVLAGDAALPPGLVTFPIAYELRGDPAKIDPNGRYLVSARLAAATPPASGLELVSEYSNKLPGSIHTMDILVSGLEPCKSPGSGGFCR